MQGVLDWLTALPPAVLYLVLALVAAVENVFPPVPADTVVAFGAFLAARGQATLAGAFLATWLGNLAGAMAMYAAGRRFGAERLERRLGNGGAAARLHQFYAHRGALALFVSRFLPGIRALVPPFAGAARVPAARAAAIIGGASALWYGGITFLAYRVGADWSTLQARMAQWQRALFIGAGAIAAVGVVVWLLRRRRTAS
ncbi:MAG TPA: VTT domain-containing protein [Gemmatimonadaceae bacterium]|nr:VTT domain-containing protein [Gemmatimonadaceae bacterium]